MDVLWWIPIAAGATDALNPCVFAIMAAFIVLHVALEGRTLLVMVLFFTSLLMTLFIFNIGIGMMAVNTPVVDIVLKVIDGILSIGFLVLGWQSIGQWQAWQKNQLIKPLSGQLVLGYLLKKKTFKWVLPLLLGAIFGVLSTQWAPNYYFAILANPAVLPGNDRLLLMLIGTYGFVILWPVWLLIIVFNYHYVAPRLKPLIAAGVMFIASTLALLILK